MPTQTRANMLDVADRPVCLRVGAHALKQLVRFTHIFRYHMRYHFSRGEAQS